MVLRKGIIDHSSPLQSHTTPHSPCRRPGVLVLVNDADWEIEGKGEYEVQDGDAISFISTLHGG